MFYGATIAKDSARMEGNSKVTGGFLVGGLCSWWRRLWWCWLVSVVVMFVAVLVLLVLMAVTVVEAVV